MNDAVCESLDELAKHLEFWTKTEMPEWVGKGHGDLVALVGHRAIQRTPIKTGRLVNNWQGWVGDSSISSRVPEVKTFSTSPDPAHAQIEELEGQVKQAGRSGQIIEKTLILNNAPYALIQEEGTSSSPGKHFTQSAIDEAEARWGDGS